MSKQLDHVFAKAFAQQNTRLRKASPAAAPNSANRIDDPVSETSLILQAASEDDSLVPTPHIVCAGTTPLKDQPLEPNHQSILFSSVTETIATTPATDEWLVATTGIQIPTSPDPELPRDEPDFVEIPESDPESQTSVAPTIEEAPVLNSITDLAEPNEEILQSLHLAADSVRAADQQLQTESGMFQAFMPVWEVDRFSWPQSVLDLESVLQHELIDTSEGILAAAAAGMCVIGVSSLQHNAGRSTTLLLLARTIAAAGGRVAMMDAADELGTLAQRCGIASPYGWNEAVVDGKPLEEAATVSLMDSSTMISWAPGATNSLADLSPLVVGMQMRRLRRDFEVILIRLPAFESELLQVLKAHPGLCDSLLMLRTASDEDHAFNLALESLQGTSVKAIGLVDNAHKPNGLDGVL